MVKQPLKWFGGKFYLADWLIGLMPPHLTYIEPYAGGLAVLMRKDPMDERHQWGTSSSERGKSEIVNDVHGGLINFWRVLQDEKAFAKFKRRIEATPFCKQMWQEAEALMMPDESRIVDGCDVIAAAAFFVRCRQARAGSMATFTPMRKNATSVHMNGDVGTWLNAIDSLPEVHNRLRRVVIFNEDAVKVIEREDDWKTLFYLDPPYMHDTRVELNGYKHEMSIDDHKRLLKTIKGCVGMVMISGYRNEIYDSALVGWHRYDKETTSGSSGLAAKRVESVWLNWDGDKDKKLERKLDRLFGKM